MLLAYPIAALPADCLAVRRDGDLRSDFVKLWDTIGTTWGAGDGTTTFNIPDLRDRALYGIGGKVGLAATDGVAFGSRGGPSHHHYFDAWTDNAGYHGHSVYVDNNGYHSHSYGDYTPGYGSFRQGTAGSLYDVAQYTTDSGRGTSGDGDHGHSASTSGDGEHSHHVNGDTDGGYGRQPLLRGHRVGDNDRQVI